jgi:hypothetical protein
MLERQSPLHSAEEIEDPLLVIQGANDPRVNKAESDQIVTAMRELGREVEYMVAPDEGHGFAGEMNRLAMNAKIEEFLADHLGGRYQREMPPELRRHLAGLMVDVATVTVAEPEDLEPGVDATFDPALVTTGAREYALEMSVGGQTLNLSSERIVDRVTLDGRDAFLVVENTTMPAGPAADTTWVDAETLLPIARHAHQGAATVTLDFAGEAVKGAIDAGTQKMDVDVSADEPVFGDGASFNVAVGALPLEDGYVTTLHRLDLMQGEADAMRIEVTGTESVIVPGGTFDAWVIEVAPPDGEPSKLWIDRDSRRVVRAELRLGAQMGGGTAIMELTGGV